MDITVKIQHNDDMRSITLISPTGDTLRVFSEEAIDFFHGVEQLSKLGVVRPASAVSGGGELLGNEAKATVAARGLSNCMFYLHKTCICKDECWYSANALKSSEGQP